MTIDEAVHRVVRRHWFLILFCVVVPVVASIAWVGRQPAEYQAVGRVQMGTDLAASNVQADAMSQRAQGIATSPGVVSRALAKAKVVSDPTIFADNNVTVTRVGVSPVLDIAVTADSPQAASKIADSITRDVITFTNEAGQASITSQQKNLQKEITAVKKQQSQLIPRLGSLDPTTDAGRILAIQAQLNGLTAAQTEFERQLSDLNISTPTTLSQQALLLDPVRASTVPQPNDLWPQAVIAGLIGLLLGLGLASLREAIFPSLRSPRAIAYAVDAPHLGHIPNSDLGAPESIAALGRIGDRIALLARGHDVHRVFVLPVLDKYDVLANLVAFRLSPHGEEDDHRVECVALDSHWEDPGDRPAAVLLCRRTISGRDLKRAMAQLEPLGWPLLGFITCETRQPRQARPESRHAASTSTEAEQLAPEAAEGVEALESMEGVEALEVDDADTSPSTTEVTSAVSSRVSRISGPNAAPSAGQS